MWADEWKLLVACMMLNCTTRLQVDRVLWRLFLLVPSAEQAVRLGAEGGAGGDGDDGDGDGELNALGEEGTTTVETIEGATGAGAIVAAATGTAAGEDSGGGGGVVGGSSRGGGDGGRGGGGGGAWRRAKKSGLDRIMEILQPLGLHRKRAKALVRLSEDYLAATARQRDAPELSAPPAPDAQSAPPPPPPQSPPPPPPPARVPLKVPVASLHGVGVYAADAHAMFCEGLMGVAPRDHALRWWYAWAIERRESRRRAAARRRSLGE